MRGYEIRGWRSEEISLEKGMANASLFLSNISLSPSFLILFLTQTPSKEEGKNFWTNLCMNWSLKKSTRWGRGRILEFLKRGSVWALYLDPLTILIAAFCKV
jgi:hypothetical protein